MDKSIFPVYDFVNVNVKLSFLINKLRQQFTSLIFFVYLGKRNVIIKILVYRLKNYHQITTFNLYNFILYNLKNKTLVLGLRCGA